MPTPTTQFLPLLRATALAAACVCAAPVLAAPPAASAAGPPSSDTPLGCLIEPSRVADVGSALVGVLARVRVERGDAVRQGQVLAELRQEVERAQVDLASSHARSQAEAQGALKAWDFARKKQLRTEELVRKEFVSRQALEQAAAEAELAQARLAQAREQLRHSARELALAQAQLGNRTLRSPISGVVVERYRNDGERVEDKPVLRIATLDPLRVEMVLPATLYGRVQAGTAATVLPDLGGLGPLRGRVGLVDRVIDAASNTFRARLELPNPGARVPAGLRCTVQFATLAAAPAPATGTAALAPPAAPEPAPARVARYADRFHPLEAPLQLPVARYAPTYHALLGPGQPQPPVRVARYPEHAPPVTLAASALPEAAPESMPLQRSAQLTAQLPPPAAGSVAPDSPPLNLALSRELAALRPSSLALAAPR